MNINSRPSAPNTRLIHIETPGNPTLTVSHIAGLRQAMRQVGPL